jgi:hypothetical protein
MADATEVVCSYEGCQYYAQQTHLPAQSAPDDPHHLAFCVLVSRPYRVAPESTRGLDPLACHHRQVLKVD